MRRTLPRGARRIKVVNGVEAEVEAIVEFHLELHSGFVLRLRDVLYVPSLQRSLISVSILDDDFIDCHFGDGKCEIQFNKECVGLAFRQDKLYLLSLSQAQAAEPERGHHDERLLRVGLHQQPRVLRPRHHCGKIG